MLGRRLAQGVLTTFGLGLVACASTSVVRTRASAPTTREVAGGLRSEARTPQASHVIESRIGNSDEIFRYRVRASEFANLFYAVECLSRTIMCTTEAFDRIANEQLGGLDEEDHRALETWRTIRERYQGRVQRTDDGAQPALPIPRSHRQIERRSRLAGFTSTTSEGFEEKIGMIVDLSDANEACRVLDRFGPRFEKVWQTSAPDLARLVLAFSERLREPEIRRTVDRVAKFYEPDVPKGTEITFELIARPESNRSTAEQLAHVSLIEVVTNELPEERLPVVLHEFFHFVFSQVPTKRMEELVDRFVTSDDLWAYPAYGLLDESLATSFGNGLIGKLVAPKELENRLGRPQGLYRDDLIDPVAKVAFRKLDGELDRGLRLSDPEFVPRWLTIVHEALPRLPPKALLRPLVIVTSPSLEQSGRELPDVVNAAQSASTDWSDPSDVAALLGDRPRWSRVLLVTRQDLPKLPLQKSVLPRALADSVMHAANKQKGGFVWLDVQKGRPATFVFVAADRKAMTDLFDRFAKLDETHPGLLLPSSP